MLAVRKDCNLRTHEYADGREAAFYIFSDPAGLYRLAVSLIREMHE